VNNRLGFGCGTDPSSKLKYDTDVGRVCDAGLSECRVWGWVHGDDMGRSSRGREGADSCRRVSRGRGEGTDPGGDEVRARSVDRSGPCKIPSGSTSIAVGFSPDIARSWTDTQILRSAIGEGGRVVREEMEVREFP
jgi:hypothetical protein